MSPTLLPTAALPSQVALHNDGTDQSLPPSLPFLHLWTGPDGLSRLNTSQLAGFQSKSVGGGAAPQWLRPFPGEVVGVQFAVLPVGWVGDWHESPHPQWVIPLRGRWFIETGDGTRGNGPWRYPFRPGPGHHRRTRPPLRPTGRHALPADDGAVCALPGVAAAHPFDETAAP